MVIRSFVPSGETQELNEPAYLSLDSDNRVFVAVYGIDRVILLDSNLKWNRRVCLERKGKQETMIGRVWGLGLCYDEETKQLIVGSNFVVLVYTVNQHWT